MKTAPNYSRHVRLIMAAGAVVLMLFFIFAWMAMSRFTDTQARWEEYNHRSSVISTTLLKVKRHLGYGGLIHNLKNLILRRDIPRYQQRIEGNITELDAELTALNALLSLQENKQQLATVRRTVDEYAAKYRIALDMVKAGNTPEEIDAIVRVDDGPALEAMAHLTERTLARTREAEAAARNSYDEARVFMLVGGLTAAMALSAAMLAMVIYLRRIMTAYDETRRIENELDSLLNTSPDPMISVAPDGRIVRANQMAVQFFGYDHSQFIGMDIDALLPQRYRHSHKGHRDSYFATPHHRPMGGGLMLKALTRDGQEPDVEINLSYFGEGATRLATVTVRDVTERERLRMERKLLEDAKSAAEAAAATDFLTGLSNRRQLVSLCTSLFANAKRNAQPIAVAVLDIDHFKKVNDTFGHDAGDTVLKALASQLKERFRATDIVARIGGEEFCVVAANLEKAAARELFEGFRKHLADFPIDVGGEKLHITISIGVTTALTANVESMIAAADALLYQAKHKGRNCVVMV
jgi:diguanylate cyclase (GGDEF)-like protein/PAS domain S-box-containing protein